jgi:hypothetical protein
LVIDEQRSGPAGSSKTMIASRATALVLAFATGSLATFGAVALSLSPADTLSPKTMVGQAFDAIAAMPAQAPQLREALAEAARGDRQPILRTDRSVRIVTIEHRTGGTSTLVRLPANHFAS